MWSRIHLIPLLQAEEDRDAVRRHYARQKMEEELLGKAVPVYNKDVYVTIKSRSMEGDTNVLQLHATDVRSHTSERDEVETRKKSIVHIMEFEEYQRDQRQVLPCNATFICSSHACSPV
jgi:hypothetical protein